jgi:RecA/RadA recombinase
MAPKTKVKTETVLNRVNKRALMEQMVEEERKIAEKTGEAIMMGRADDFTDMGRESYHLTSILGIDLNIGGFKEGTINVIWGDSQAGKTTNSVGIMEGIQMHRPDAVFGYFDTEQTINDSFLDRYPYLNQQNIFFSRETKLEAIVDKMRQWINDNMVDYIIFDSYDATASKGTYEKSFEKDSQQVMDKAAVLSRAMPEIQEGLKKHGITLIIIQQVRVGFNRGMQAYDVRSGGNALKFSPSTVLKLANQSQDNELDENGMVVTRYVRFKNEKSKVSRPYATTHSYINVDPNKNIAIHRRRECIDYCIEYGLMESKGAWVYLNLINPETGELEELKFNGKARAIAAFNNDVDLYSTMKFKVYAKGLPTELFIVKYDEIITMLEQENYLMKQNKINTYTMMGIANRLTEKDYKKFTIDKEKYTIDDMFNELFPVLTTEELEENPTYKNGNQILELARFNLMTVDEQKKYLAKKEK